jgi:tetratricopeptide (TPR) repeat protein
MIGMLYLFICSGMIANPLVVQAADAGEQDFAKGGDLLKQKQYADARAALEAGIKKNPSNAQAHFNLAEACRGLKAWACAEEHYETALQLDAKSSATGSTKPRLHKATVWRLLDEVTAWRLLDEAKGLIAGGKASPDKMKQAEDTLDSANELGLNSCRRNFHDSDRLPYRTGGNQTDWREEQDRPIRKTCRWHWCRQGSSRWEVI